MRYFLLCAFLFACLSANFTRAADVIWVHQMRGGGDGVTGTAAGEGTLTWEDDEWRKLIEGRGHNIVKHQAYDNLETLSIGDYDQVIAEFEATDLVIFTRDSNSGDYNDPIEHEAWTSAFSTPMIIMTPYLLRSNRWDMVQSTSIVDAANPMVPVVADHPIFEGVELNADGQIDFFSQLGPDDNIDLLGTTDYGWAQVIAAEAETEFPWIAYWDGEAEGGDFYDGSFTFAGGPRLFLSAGSDDDPNTWGEKNVTPAGDQIVLNAITFLTGDPGTVAMLPGDCNGDGKVDAADLSCVATIDERDIVLGELNTLPGDLDGDGSVAFPDFLVLSTNFNDATKTAYTEGDIDLADGVVFADFLIMSTNFNKTPAGAAASSVPEPRSDLLVWLAALVLGVVRRRRRSR